MGLIRAALGSAGGALADSWKEYIYCESMDSDVLVCRGRRRTSGRSSNRRGSASVITDGSVIAVADGQCMMIVENGKVAEVCAEPGEFVYESGREPSIFGGTLAETLEKTFEEARKRFAFGGEAPTDQRVYYFNTKEIVGNKYGTPTPVPFRVLDQSIGLDVDISIRCNGEYSYQIADPILFYTNVCGNVEDHYLRAELDSMQKSELLTALQPAFARISEQGIRYSALPAHTFELTEALGEVLSAKWRNQRGIQISSIGVNSVSASREDEEMIKQLQKSTVYRNPTMAAAALASAQADAMRTAAGNPAGAMTGFMGMGMASAQGGIHVQDLYAMGAQQTGAGASAGNEQGSAGAPSPEQPLPGNPSSQDLKGRWQCSCGHWNTGKFCSECGARKPQSEWRCSCGAVNTGKFCQECGARRPDDPQVG